MRSDTERLTSEVGYARFDAAKVHGPRVYQNLPSILALLSKRVCDARSRHPTGALPVGKWADQLFHVEEMETLLSLAQGSPSVPENQIYPSKVGLPSSAVMNHR